MPESTPKGAGLSRIEWLIEMARRNHRDRKATGSWHLVAAALLCGWLPSWPALAADATVDASRQDPRPVVDATVRELEAARHFILLITRDGMSSLTDGSLERLDRIADMRELFYREFAYREIARLVLGRRWHTATADERASFIEALAGFVAEKVVDNLSEGHFEIFSASLIGTPNEDVTLIDVHTVLREPTYSTPVVWTVQSNGEEFKILDLTISGQSFLLAQKDNFERILRRNNDSLTALTEAIRPAFLN